MGELFAAKFKSNRYSIILHEKDNVATVLDSEEKKNLLEDGTLIEDNIPIGHKVAIHDTTERTANY